MIANCLPCRLPDSSGPHAEQINTQIAQAAHDAQQCRALAEAFEQAGQFDAALQAFHAAHRADPSDQRVLAKLAELSYEFGDSATARSCWEQLHQSEPANPVYLAPFIELLYEEGDPSRADEVLLNAVAHGLSDSDAARLRRTRGGPTPEPVDPPLSPADADCIRFANLFAGREDIYARQWADPLHSRSGYSPVREPFTPAVARNHLLGSQTIGIYPIRLDGSAQWCVIDLDIERNAIDDARRDPLLAKALRDDLAQASQAIGRNLSELGLRPLFENSGHKGRHWWILFQQPQPAAELHRFGMALLQRLKPALPSTLHLEFFPKQGKTAGKGLGNLVKLPLGIHRLSGRRSELLDDCGRPVADPFALLREAPRLDTPSFRAVADRLLAEAAPQGVPAVAAEVQTSEQPNGDSETRLPAPPQLPPLWTEADFLTHAGVFRLFSLCPVLAELKKRAEEFRKLSSDEQVVLLHTVGHLDVGPQAVNYIFRQCPEITSAQMMKSPLKGSPISCPKIRKRLPHIVARVPCSCDFSFAPDHYPTPLLQLRSPAADAILPPVPSPKQNDPAAGSLEQLARRLGVLERRRQLIEQQWKTLHDQLCSAIRAIPERSLSLDDGRYELRQADDIEELVWVPNASTPPLHSPPHHASPQPPNTPTPPPGDHAPTDSSSSVSL